MSIRNGLVAGVWAGFVLAAGAFPMDLHQQGRLIDGTNLVNGAATIVYRLYDVEEGGAALAGGTNEVMVVDGLYAATLELAPEVWASVLANAEIYLETEIDGTALAPRERIGAAAYALLAAGVRDGAIGEHQLAAGAVTEGKLDAGAVTEAKIGMGAVTMAKLGANSVNSDRIVDGSITANDVAANAFWRTNGNTGMAAGSFIGTTDGTSFEIRCMNEAVIRADWNFAAAGTTIRMGRSNTVDFAPGGVLAGGYQNRIGGNNYNVTLSGGTLNVVEYEAQNAVLAGGYRNRVGTNAFDSTLSGGANNTIGVSAEGAVIAGGQNNMASATNAAVGGGLSNVAAGVYAVVAGGKWNSALGDGSVIGGGSGNVVSNTASTIVGGFFNVVGAAQSFIGGGGNNRSESAGGVIAGGQENFVLEQFGTVGGGANNFAGGGNGWATVGGGYWNMATGTYAVVAGGYGNVAQQSGFVGGGDFNRMGAGGRYGTIAGGQDNTIEVGQFHNTIGGGKGNYVTASTNTIAGGVSNRLFAPYGFIGGGYRNFSQGDYGVVAGGGSNIVDGHFGFIGGGWDNYAAGGGTVAGGVSNSAAGTYSIIPGGLSNTAAGAYGFAAGRRARAAHDGAFVWADSTDAAFASTLADQFNVRAANGSRFIGSTNLGSLTVSPLNSGDNRDAQIYLTEGDTGTYGMFLKYDGLLNQFQVIGKNGATTNGPHLVVARDASRLGVGRTPAVNALEVEGDASKTVAGNWLANSDERIKTEVRTIENAVETLAKLRPVAFRYTEDHRAKHPSIADRDYNNFIAQEYREVFPAAVKEDGEGLLMVDTYDVQPYLVRAVQELHGMVGELRAENQALRERLDALDPAR
jgi:trimeric autotransporter adhesin